MRHYAELIAQLLKLIAPYIGCLCLGLTIGWLVRFFVEKYKEHNAKILGSTISVLSGGGIVALLKYVSGGKDLLAPSSFYMIGLPFGMLLLYPMVFHWDTQFRLATRYDEERAERQAEERKRRYERKLLQDTRRAVEDSTAELPEAPKGN